MQPPFDPTNVENKPFLDSFTIDMSSTGLNGTVGLSYRVKVGAVNSVGEVDSDSIEVFLASVPS